MSLCRTQCLHPRERRLFAEETFVASLMETFQRRSRPWMLETLPANRMLG